MTKVLVLYYSSFGHIEQMAYAEAEGARAAKVGLPENQDLASACGNRNGRCS